MNFGKKYYLLRSSDKDFAITNDTIMDLLTVIKVRPFVAYPPLFNNKGRKIRIFIFLVDSLEKAKDVENTLYASLGFSETEEKYAYKIHTSIMEARKKEIGKNAQV